MTIANMELYDALLEGGTSDAKARAAAASLASYERAVASIERDLTVLKWMTGTVLAGVLALITMLARLLATGGGGGS